MLTNTERQQIVEEVNAGTYGIDEALDDIAAAQKGEEVRKALYAEALVLNREGHAGSTDMIARQQVANLQTSVNGQISTLRTEVGDDINDLETALNSGLATQNGKIAAQNATIANVVANYNVEYGSTELWASTGETGALAAGTTVTLSEDVSHFDYIDIYSFCGNSNVLDTVPVDAKLQSSQGYALRWVNLSDPDSGSYKAYVRIIETRLHIIGTTLTIDHQVTYRNGEEVNISGAEITQSNRSTYVGELGIMKIVGRKITANTEVTDIRTGADGTTYNSAGAAVRNQISCSDDRVLYSNEGLQTFKGLGNFQHYGLDTNGGFLTSQKYRVSNDDPMTFDRDVTISAANGFRWGYAFFSNGNATWKGWYTAPATIPKGTSFVVQIARVTENTSEVANVDEFLNAVTFENIIVDNINKINPKSPKVFESSDFVNGVWENGKLNGWDARLCTKLYPVRNGNKFVYSISSGFDVSFVIYNSDMSAQYFSGWITPTGESEYEFANNGLFALQIRKTNGKNLTPSEYSGDCNLFYGIVDSVENRIDDIEKSIIIESYASDYDLVSGTINQNGSESADTARVRTNEYIDIESWESVVKTDSNYRFGLHFYDASKIHLSNTEWITDIQYRISPPENCKYIKLVFSKTNNATITPEEVEKVIKLLSKPLNTIVKSNTEAIAEINYVIGADTKPFSYVGEKIPSKINYFDASKILTMSYSSPLTSQDIECFGDYLFVAFSDTEQIKVYSLSTKILIASIEIEVQHGTGMQFSNEYYDSNDPFPLLYVGGWISNQSNVIRITNDNDVWGATIIRKLIIPNTEGYYLAPSIDADHNTLYAYGYSINSNQASGNSMKLIKADLSNLTDNSDGTYTPKILSSVETPYVGVTQGRKFFGGNLYVGFANTGNPHNARLVAVDATSGDVKTDVSMSGVTTSENEGVCYQIVDSEVIWYYSDYYNVFKVLF